VGEGVGEAPIQRNHIFRHDRQGLRRIPSCNTTKFTHMPQFAYTILYVEDVAEALAFYEKAFGLSRKFIAPDNSYGELQSGSTNLSFASKEMVRANVIDTFIDSSRAQPPFGIEIAFTSDDVPATVDAAVKAGALLVAEPKTKPWGQIVAYVRDPEGFLVEICTPMG
jgi:uncharacterized glyoxalase superfamily protein PhnB